MSGGGMYAGRRYRVEWRDAEGEWCLLGVADEFERARDLVTPYRRLVLRIVDQGGGGQVYPLIDGAMVQ